MGETTGELKQQIEQQRNALSQDLDALGDKVSPRRIADRQRDAMRSRVQSAKTTIMGTASDIGDKANPAAMVHSGQEKTKQQVAGAPLAAGAMAFAAGLVVAVLLPETRREQALAENVQPMVEDMASTVSDAAQQGAQHLKPAAQDAAEAVKDQAQSAAESVKSQAQDAAATVKDEASSPTR